MNLDQLAVWEYHARHHKVPWRACTHERCRAALDDIETVDLIVWHTRYVAAINQPPRDGQQTLWKP